MQKRRIDNMKLIGYFWLIFLLIGTSFAKGIDEEAVFEERLLKWVDCVNALVEKETPENVQNLENALTNISSFYRDYPKNKYADDAKFIYNKSIDASEEAWEELVNKYPEGKIEEFTKEQLRGLKGNFKDFVYEFFIPYNLLITYVKGQLGWLKEQNYDKAIHYLSEFVKKVDYGQPELKKISYVVYSGLLKSCKELNKKESYEKIKEEMIILFPEKKEQIEQYW